MPKKSNHSPGSRAVEPADKQESISPFMGVVLASCPREYDADSKVQKLRPASVIILEGPLGSPGLH